MTDWTRNLGARSCPTPREIDNSSSAIYGFRQLRVGRRAGGRFGWHRRPVAHCLHRRRRPGHLHHGPPTRHVHNTVCTATPRQMCDQHDLEIRSMSLTEVAGYGAWAIAIASIDISSPRGSSTFAGADRAGGGSGM
jgi:hypothetical protein